MSMAILRKMKQELTAYRIEIHGERHPEHPRRFTEVTITHYLQGNTLDPKAVEKAVKLSDEKVLLGVGDAAPADRSAFGVRD
jgi:putative redox protein